MRRANFEFFELQLTKAPIGIRVGRRTRARTRCGKQQGLGLGPAAVLAASSTGPSQLNSWSVSPTQVDDDRE